MVLSITALPMASLGDDARRSRQALRVDTSDPPGHERISADYLAAALAEVGDQQALLGLAPGRTRLIARHRAWLRCPRVPIMGLGAKHLGAPHVVHESRA